jgi:hypothetical protein
MERTASKCLQIVPKNTMNRLLFELLRRVEEGARRLSVNHHKSGDKPLRNILLVETELQEITNALEAFKSEVAAGVRNGYISDRLL